MFEWLHKVNVRVYLCQAMTGVRQDKIYQKNYYCMRILSKRGITSFSPVSEEGISPSKKKLDQPSQEQLHRFWRRDIFLIEHSHVLLDISGPSTSQGSLHEIGKSRYLYFKPICRVMKLKGPSVVVEQDDLVFSTVEKAAAFIVANFGTPWLRLKWKLNIFRKCFFSYIKVRLLWWVDWL